MSYISVDIEADGPIPGDYSMVSLGAVVVQPELDTKFYTELRPISDQWNPDALRVSGFTREKTLEFQSAESAMMDFDQWLREINARKLRFVSDNAGFDWQFVNYYFWHFMDKNPFGHSSLSLTSLYKGAKKDIFANFKHLRKTRHSHNALDDAVGNAEALLEIKRQFRMTLPL